MKKSTILQLSIGGLITAGGLYIFFKDVKPAQLWLEIQATPWYIILGVALLNPLSLWFRALRWKIILSSKQSPVNELYPLVMIGFMANNIFPARLGEALRAFLLWKRNGYTLAESIGSLVIERIIDILIFTTFFFVPVFLNKSLSSLYWYGLILTAVFAGSCLVAGLYALLPRQIGSVALLFVKFFPDKIRSKVTKIGSEVVSNINWVFSIQKVASVAVLSFLIMFCYAGMMYLLGKAVTEFSFLDSMFGVAFAALGAAIPLAPGYVGTMHAVLLQGLSLAGIPADKSGGIVVLYHAIGYITVTVLGLYYFFSIKLSFKDIGSVKSNLAEQRQVIE